MGAQVENELEAMDFVSGRGGQEEKIFVTVRVRPMSARELAHGETSVWRCQDEQTLLYTEPAVDRSPYPAYYHFGQCLDSCTTYQLSAGYVSHGRQTGDRCMLLG